MYLEFLKCIMLFNYDDHHSNRKWFLSISAAIQYCSSLHSCEHAQSEHSARTASQEMLERTVRQEKQLSFTKTRYLTPLYCMRQAKPLHVSLKSSHVAFGEPERSAEWLCGGHIRLMAEM